MANNKDFDTRDLDFHLVRPEDLDPGLWNEFATLDDRAVQSAFPHRTPADIMRATGTTDMDRYIARNLDPNVAVGHEFGGNQAYSEPLIAYATTIGRASEVVAKVYGANNASGPTAEIIDQRLKARLLPIHKWAWFHTASVDPSYQGRGLAPILAMLIGDKRNPLQPVSTYAWQTLHVKPMLRKLGMYGVDESYEVHPFGEDRAPIYEQRYIVRTIHQARQHLLQQPGAKPALKHARRIAKLYGS